jgi:hypothetical protein
MKTEHFIVKWAHYDPNHNYIEGEPKPTPKVTRCIIAPVNAPEEIITTALTVVGRKDQFNKKIGCKLSLIRAVQKIDDRNLRSEIYTAVKNNTKILQNHSKYGSKKQF